MTSYYQLGLLGRKLVHSKSPQIFDGIFKRDNVKGTYQLFEIPTIESLPELIESQSGLDGFNVTFPYKEDIIPYLDLLDKSASEAGAVNTVKIVRGDQIKPRLIGYNTDIGGFEDSITPLITSISKPAVLICGTGGAAKGAGIACMHLNITPIFVSRTPDKEILHFKSFSYENIDDAMMRAVDVIVNATPLGTYPNVEEFPPLPYHLITSRHIAIDLVYNPAVTKFMELCAVRGAIVRNGLSMLYGQAERAWKIWRED